MSIRRAFALLFWAWFAPAAVGVGTPEVWVPARWDGGPLEVAHRSGDKALNDPAVREAISRWYEPATLTLLEGTPINCLLVTFSGGGGAELEKHQQQIVKQYAAKARERGIAVLGLVYPGADASAVASAAAGAALDGIVLEGEFPGGMRFAEDLENALRSSKSLAVVIPVGKAASVRKASWPVWAVQGVSPGVGKRDDTATASASGGAWIDSNLWLQHSIRVGRAGRPVWISHRPAKGAPPGFYLKSVADSAAAGGRWIMTLDDSLRTRLLHQDPAAKAAWRETGALMMLFEKHAEWRTFAPFGNLGVVLDAAGPRLDMSEEYLNLLARHHIPYRVIDRARFNTESLEGLRAVIAFDLTPLTEVERKNLQAFAEDGGLVLAGPAWGSAPKEQSYSVTAAKKGEVAVFKEESPDPAELPRELNDLLVAEDFGVNVFNAPSVLSYVSTSESGKRVLIQLVNYADLPSDAITIWVSGKFSAARLYTREGAVDLTLKRSPSRTEVIVPKLATYGALLLE